ncbi:unnamed protein product [Cuscuta campestris]|uniref:Uncharacterized protein n=1 Tax=Cuscuta campestris TaxID=132261 RepID=A0A484KGU7_9ASTE|nr:unnamed protein product [Cuscuta campestris]
MTWCTELEEVAYSVVEYIPLVGTVYSLKRAGIAYTERDWLNHWQSLGNLLESSVCDIVLYLRRVLRARHGGGPAHHGRVVHRQDDRHLPPRPPQSRSQKRAGQGKRPCPRHGVVGGREQGPNLQWQSQGCPPLSPYCLHRNAHASRICPEWPGRLSSFISGGDCATGHASPFRGDGLKIGIEQGIGPQTPFDQELLLNVLRTNNSAINAE